MDHLRAGERARPSSVIPSLPRRVRRHGEGIRRLDRLIGTNGRGRLATQELDADTLNGFRHGDPQAQRRVFERYRDRVHSIALHFLRGDDAAAKDVTQEVFVKLFRTAASFRAESRLSTWLYRIVANTCIDELRRRRRLVLFGDVPPAIHPIARPEEPEAETEVTVAVRRLSPKLRLAVLLRYFDGLSYEEIARALGCTPGTVASRLSRAHAVLAQSLAHLRPARAGQGSEHARHA